MKEQILKEALAPYFTVGAAVSNATINSHEVLLCKHFSSLTCENVMKFELLHPEENRYTFEAADAIVAFARENKFKMRGHTLVWHNQTGKWIFENEDGTPASKACIGERLKAHMETVIRRYEKEVYAWDVVNEAISDEKDVYLRPSKWLELYGPEFIEDAFRMAHEIDPDAILFYNDYNAVVPEKRDKIIRLIKDLQAKGVPIHGIGLQGHFNIVSPTIGMIQEALEAYSALGLQIQITELDVSLFAFEDRSNIEKPTEAMIQAQADYYADLIQLFKDYQQTITGVTWWGCSDEHSWLNDFPVHNRKNWPLLFDERQQPKPCFYRLFEV